MSKQTYPLDDIEDDATSEIGTLRRRLQDFDKTIEATRIALTAHAARKSCLDQEWEDMLRAHAEKRLRLETAGSLTGQFIEGLSLDLDVLRHSLQRWMLHNDRA